MINQFKIHNDKDMEKWDHFIESHPGGTPFHTSSWLHTIHETYSFEPLLYVSKKENGDISSVLPLFRLKSAFFGTRLISLPFSDFCPPLFDTEEDFEEIISYLLSTVGKKTKYIEVRGNLPKKTDFICHNYYKQHYIKLTSDPIETKKNINKRTIQYSIRKAQKAEVEIREENSLQGIEEFYKLNLMTRKKHGVPPQPKKLFLNLFQHMVAKGYASILLAVWDSLTIAAGIFMRYKETVYYKYNVSNPLYLTKKSPNHLLTWKAIEQACLEGYRYFDFGRSAPDNTGLMRYKEMWGAEKHDLPYFYYPQVKGIGSKGEGGLLYGIVTKLWRKMPNAIVSKLGPIIYRHLN